MTSVTRCAVISALRSLPPSPPSPRRDHPRPDPRGPRPARLESTDLARVPGGSEIAIKNLERGATDPRVSTVNRIQEAFDHAGVIFLDTGDIREGGPGLRLKRS